MSQDVHEKIRPAERTIIQLIAFKTGVAESMVGLYSDFEALLIELISSSTRSVARRVVTAGTVTAEVQLAIDKAGHSCNEVCGNSPFSSDIDAVLAAITDPTDTVFVSNPNRVTGTDWSLADLEEIANAIPDGLLIVDEFYHDYYGISADPLLMQYTNVVVLRSPAPALGFPGSCGYLIASPYQIDRLMQARALGISSDFELATLNECLYDTERLYELLKSLHEEALRIVGELSRLGFQSRLTPFDKLLVKVASTASAGNHLAKSKVGVENLDGFPGLKNHIRIAIGSPEQNDRTIAAFKLLAQSGVTSRRPARRTLELKRSPEQAEIDALRLPPARLERLKAFVDSETELEKAAAK